MAEQTPPDQAAGRTPQVNRRRFLGLAGIAASGTVLW